MQLSHVQEQVFRIIGDLFNEHGPERGWSPSLGEIAERRRCARNGVVQALRTLERKGFIKRRGARGIEVLPIGAAFLAGEENPYL